MVSVGSSSQGLSAPFVGRMEQLAVAKAALESAASGRPEVIWIEGVAGSGKTTLVRRVLADLPEGFGTVRVRCDELATDVPFDLAAQLGITDCESPFAAAQELLEIWARLQEKGPVLVVVEDAHWADTPSSLALMSALRRLDADRVIVMITSRPAAADLWDRLLGDDERCRRLTVGRFEPHEVAALASSHGVELTERQAARLCSHTGGHPIWVRTLLTELTSGELQTAEVDLPAPRSMASAVTARLAALPSSARDLAAALAVVNQRASLTLVGRVGGISTPVEALESLLPTGFVRWQSGEPGSPVEFAHPLYRLAIYDDLSPTRRRDLHRSAARALTPGSVLAHRVAAADGVDDSLADELEAVAAFEGGAGRSTALAARNLLWASALSGSSDRGEDRLLQAALTFLDAGHPAQAARLRMQLEACRDSARRDLVLGMIDWELGDAAAARLRLRLATEAESQEQDQFAVARAWAQLSEIHVIAGEAEHAVTAGQKALSLAEPGTATERIAWMHLATGEAMMRGGPAGLERLAVRLPELPEEVGDDELDLLVTRATLSHYCSRNQRARADLLVVLGMVQRGKVPVQLARCHYLMAALLTNTGEWDDAELHARTALSIATDDHLVWVQSQCHAALATLLAYRGLLDEAQFQLDRARSKANVADNLEAAGRALVAAGALARAQGDPTGTINALEGLASVAPMLAGLYFWPSLVEAFIETGQLDRAGTEIENYRQATDIRGIEVGAVLTGLRARLAAAFGKPTEAAELFESAFAQIGPDDIFLERALLHQAYAGMLMARGAKRLAADHFRSAREMLIGAKAEPFLARIDGGRSSGHHDPHLPSLSQQLFALTDRERDVALLVARGLSNPEVAAQLYVSRKAVEYHLSNIYAKVGITSRRQLRELQLSG